VQLLNRVLDEIVVDLHTPVLAIAGNHDSPSRLHFGSTVMREKGLHLVGQMTSEYNPVILHDEFGEVHFHLIPYCDPSIVRDIFQDETIKSHDDAMGKIVQHLQEIMDAGVRHVFIGHTFVTPYGEKEANTSESERPLSIGGAEYVNAAKLQQFDYVALGHLHQAHYVLQDHIRYAGSLLKYSLSEENHQKGYFIVELDEHGKTSIEKRSLHALRDVRLVEGLINDILQMPNSEDYIFVRLLNETAVLSPMEKVRSVFPNCMHIERKKVLKTDRGFQTNQGVRHVLDDIDLFRTFYQEVTGTEMTNAIENIFKEMLEGFEENEHDSADQHPYTYMTNK